VWIEPVTLEGRFVRLEPLAERHAEDLAAAATPDLFPYHFPPRELSPEGFREQMRGLALTSMVPFALLERDSGRAVGMSAYMDIQEHHRTLEIGFTWIGRPWQGSAVNPESKLLLLGHAFDTRGAVRVQLKTDARNLQSQGALDKLGAVREGVLRKHMLRPDGHQRDTVMYSILADEWPAVRAGLEQRLASRSRRGTG
jgi:RimJ/RimL family protein N-acetyltransferase